MRSLTNIIGILLVVFGIFVFAYKGFTYTKEEKIAEIGSVQVTAEKEKTVFINPTTGGIALVAGIVLVMISRRRS